MAIDWQAFLVDFALAFYGSRVCCCWIARRRIGLRFRDGAGSFFDWAVVALPSCFRDGAGF